MSHGKVIHVDSDDQFDSIIQSSGDKIVAVDFYADWCGPCKFISPRFEQLSSQYPNITFLKVNVDSLRRTSTKCGIEAMPTFQFFKNNSKIEEFRGADPSRLESVLKKLASLSAEPKKRDNKRYSKSELESMSVKELKEILKSRNVNTNTFFEKSDIIQEVLNSN